jgi:hypothetical protein
MFIAPLCRVHHLDLHRLSDEKEWWGTVEIEPMQMQIAQKL